MDYIHKSFSKLEINRLTFSLEKLRQHPSSAYLKMADSITHYSQLVPIIVVPNGNQQWTLIDGHLRTRALQKLGADTCDGEIWECDMATALLLRLTSAKEKNLAAIEEANILDILHHEHGMSQHEIAKNLARDVSWVNRRLALLKDLPAAAYESYCQGQLSTWMITRVIQPLARANKEHANQLVMYLNKNLHSTREVQKFFEHYISANKDVRYRMISNPMLFFASVKNTEQRHNADVLNIGPEGKWKKNLDIIKNSVTGLQKLITTIFYSNQNSQEQTYLLNSFKETQKTFLEFENLVEGHVHAITTNSSDHTKDACSE